ncbi:trehalose-6-phosphate phosphatase [Spathaspora passalidarum NRRL Y-27907]|uniref:Trehalose-6-phosphate phosphatase n=1 Tax=Spathaspora passalidarum (strain NRRL Y-27907 / 11-Y1) TaxID=619300 RepID=G3AFE8_SPAPN|nr:trehalose-6-phosphate phosphatase [Spathaspora passalidarum NRRL Y-27907]EGW34937.1 trehalose-6-phosphate phosphatase [Spathaspora passalidarum NRRL Y-27907]
MTEIEELKAYPADCSTVSPKDYANHTHAKLSGRILNVMTTLPTQIISNYDPSSGDYLWDVEAVRGNSALYSSQHFLDQHSDWESHLIAWTGEINASKVTRWQNGDNVDDALYLVDEDKQELEAKLREANGSENIHPVWLLRRDQSRWRKYAEKVLWPVFHYIQGQPSDGKEEAEAWHDYVKFNEVYLNKIKSVYKPGDVILIHDYYLLLLPQLLRMEFPDAYIGLFLHIPFPSSEYFRCLSKRTQLLDGMLGADKIGFQSGSFQRHFLSCCARLLGFEVTSDKVFAFGTTISVETLPIGVDTKKIEHDAFLPDSGIEEKVTALKELYKGKKIIVGRDRLDKVRGVVQKLEAFGMFLEMYPEWREKVVLIQVSSPGFTHSANVESKVTELINQINSQYGNLNYTPILHYQMMIPKDEYLALLRVADLALITSVRDGMNTTAFEFVICQKYNSSPLVLSEFTGTASVLNEAILINPWDTVGIAKTINEAFLLSDKEKQQLEARLYEKVTSNTVQNWISTFIRDVIDHSLVTHVTNYTPTLNRPLLLKNYLNSSRRLFLFDYDGTLTPIVKEPAAAIPSDKLNRILDVLAADPKNQIWIISGRDQAFLDKWMGDKNVGLSAEHGCFMKDLGSKEWVNLAASFDMSWQAKVEEVYKDYTEKTPGSHIERKKVALTWHYRRADPELGNYQAAKCLHQLNETIAKEYDCEVMAGKANIEVRPKFLNKGEIVKRLVLHPHGSKQDLHNEHCHSDATAADQLPDFVLCLGDDLTDEDMFRSLKTIEAEWTEQGLPKNEFGSYGVYPVAVGPASKQTVATSHLNEPSQVLETLGLLAGQVSLFESAGTVELDDRGHLANSESSERSKTAIERAASLRRKASLDKEMNKKTSTNGKI